MMISASEYFPNFRRGVATSNHLHLRVSKVEHEFGLGLEIFCRLLGFIGFGGLGCATYQVPLVRLFEHQCHPCGPCKVVGAREFVEVVTSRSGWDERSSVLRC